LPPWQEERHGRHDHNARVARSFSVMPERIQIGLYLRCDIQIGKPRSQRGLDHGRRCTGEGTGAIDDSSRTRKRAVE